MRFVFRAPSNEILKYGLRKQFYLRLLAVSLLNRETFTLIMYK